MGHFRFTWPYPAGEVFVTGEFDKWTSSVKLEKDGETGHFSAVVDLGDHEKTFYKYIVDGNWCTNIQEKIEQDGSGIENNVIYKTDMHTPEPALPAETAFIQSAAPESTTAALAAAVPHEESQTAFTSSVAPTSTTAELAAQVPYTENATTEETSSEIKRPTPGFSDVPGGFPETPAVDQDEVAAFHVNPLPAFSTPGNPISLAAGEQIPEFQAAAVHDTLTLDKESYEKADASNLGVGFDFSSIPAAVSTSDSIIPESSLPIVAATAESVPAVVKESQAIANASPEASAIESQVQKKDALENELIANPPRLHHHTDEAVAADNVPAVVKESQAIAHASPEASANEALVYKKDVLEYELLANPPHLQHKAEEFHHQPQEAVAADNVPEVVKESQAIAHASPEASASATLVQQKDILEQELTFSPPALHHNVAANAVPEVVVQSQAAVKASPEASASDSQVQKKEAVEQELLANPPHLEHVQENSLAAPSTIRAVEPEASTENTPPSATGNRPVSPAALVTPPVATTTTSTFTTPVPGTTTFTSQKPSSTNSADSAPKSDDDTKEKISGEFGDKSSDKRKEKRRSHLFQRIRNIFK
ncbi:hypothetical protein DFH27DRAFT_527912 [Peziza echinospora]|nr:hypothetical protein DFH27DRAFT_527912 [Peziza echinospora]